MLVMTTRHSLQTLDFRLQNSRESKLNKLSFNLQIRKRIFNFKNNFTILLSISLEFIYNCYTFYKKRIIL